MRTGIISSAIFYAKSQDERFRRIRELGFDTADESLEETESPFYESMDALERHCYSIRNAAEKHGVEIYQTHGPYGLWSGTEDRGELISQIAENYRMGFRGCNILGAKYFVIHPVTSYGRMKEYGDVDATLQTEKLLRALVPLCEEYGVTVCLENMPMTRFTISPPEMIAKTVRDVGSPYIRSCLDTGHQSLFNRNIGDDLRLMADTLRCFHIHDSNGYDDIHLIPYHGVIDWDSFTTAAAETGCDIPLSFETETCRRKVMPPELCAKTEELLAETARSLADEIERKKSGLAESK